MLSKIGKLFKNKATVTDLRDDMMWPDPSSGASAMNPIPPKSELQDIIYGVFSRKGKLKSLHYDPEIAKGIGKPSDVVHTLLIGTRGIKGDLLVSTQ